MGRLTAPWWAVLAAFAAGLFFPMGGDSGAATDELRASVEAAEVDRELWRAKFYEATARADSATEAHAALAQRSDSTIARLSAQIQTTTERAADLADDIRARVDEETAGLVTEMEAEWQATLEAERAQTAMWEARALSAEAGWRDERFARIAAERALEASDAAHDSKDALVRALESQISRANRDKKLLALAGIAGVAWGLSR